MGKKLNILQPFNKIAFDFDDTLVGSKNSKLLWDFINDNPEKTYFIITHRTAEQARTIPQELSRDTTIRFEQFSDLYTLPNRLAIEFEHDSRIRRLSKLPPLETVPEDALMPGEYKYLNWKGFAAMKAGASVLIDDLPALSRLGCRKHHVILINTRSLSPDKLEEYSSLISQDKMPYRYWFKPSTEELIELPAGEEHGLSVIKKPEQFDVVPPKVDNIDSDVLRQMITLAKSNGWVRVLMPKNNPSHYSIDGNNQKDVLRTARKFDQDVHYIGSIMTEFGSAKGDEVRNYLRTGIMPSSES